MIPTPPVELQGLPRQVYEALAEQTAFPWPALLAQCRRQGIDPARMSTTELRRIVDDLVTAVAAFTSPQKGERLRKKLGLLAE